MPGMFGVFYYRSANRRTLETLSEFLPVPVADLAAEFGDGASAGRHLRAIHTRADGRGGDTST